MAEYLLFQKIVELSESDQWDTAKLEWNLAGIHFVDIPETCLCGHYPIKEICTIINLRNGSITEVGNCCVKKFLGLPSDKIFRAIKRIKQDNAKALNAEAIQYAHERGWISARDRAFSMDTKLKRRLSPRQLAWREDVNRRVLAGIAAARRPPKRIPALPPVRSIPPIPKYEPLTQPPVRA